MKLIDDNISQIKDIVTTENNNNSKNIDNLYIDMNKQTMEIKSSVNNNSECIINLSNKISILTEKNINLEYQLSEKEINILEKLKIELDN